MVLKLNISNKGKAYKVEIEPEVLSGKKVGDTIKGEEINADLSGYELKITGGTDFAGFAMKEDVEGITLKRVLLTKGWGMQKRPRGDKKKVPQPDGLRLRKTVRGNTVFEKTVQINFNVVKEGSKKWEDLTKKAEPVAEGEAPAEEKAEGEKEAPKEEAKVKEKKEEAAPKEEKKE